MPVPASVHQVIAARIDGLEPEQKALLQDAAVVGEVFWPGALASIGGLDEAACRTRLAELTLRDFVTPEPSSAVANERQYTFKSRAVPRRRLRRHSTRATGGHASADGRVDRIARA